MGLCSRVVCAAALRASDVCAEAAAVFACLSALCAAPLAYIADLLAAASTSLERVSRTHARGMDASNKE